MPHEVRHHKGICQRGPKKGQLKKGYKYDKIAKVKRGNLRPIKRVAAKK